MKQETNIILKEIIKEKLPIIRHSFGISQKQLADYLGCHYNQYRYWECGKSSPSILSLKMIVTDFFQISLDDFLNDNISAVTLLEAWRNSGNTFSIPLEKRQSRDNVNKTRDLIKKRLPLLREAKGITKHSLIETIGIRFDVYSAWEKGTRCPDALMLKKIINDVFHFSLDDFLDESIPIEALTSLQMDSESRENELKMIIKKKLPKLRESANISQDEMATYIGVDKNIYDSWERGSKIVDVLALKKIVEVFGISIDDFLDKPRKTLISTRSQNELKPFLLNSHEQRIIMYLRQKE